MNSQRNTQAHILKESKHAWYAGSLQGPGFYTLPSPTPKYFQSSKLVWARWQYNSKTKSVMLWTHQTPGSNLGEISIQLQKIELKIHNASPHFVCLHRNEVVQGHCVACDRICSMFLHQHEVWMRRAHKLYTITLVNPSMLKERARTDTWRQDRGCNSYKKF